VHDNGVALAELALVDQHTLRDLPQHGWLLPLVVLQSLVEVTGRLTSIAVIAVSLSWV
jgi:hypothetical protein